MKKYLEIALVAIVAVALVKKVPAVNQFIGL